jgi:signal transduction histidine kinase/CheY-like chemotaxis protein
MTFSEHQDTTRGTPEAALRARPRLRTDPQPYGDLTVLNTRRVLLDAAGSDVLMEAAADYLRLLQSATAIFEQNGDYALGLFASDWCRLINETSRRACDTAENREALRSGRWVCHESCWRAGRAAAESGQVVDVPCAGGLHVYAVPIEAKREVVGSIVVGYGDPPTDPERLRELADELGVDADELRARAEAYVSPPPGAIAEAKQRVHTAARLLSEIVARRRTEEALRSSEAQLRQRAEELAEADRRKDEFLALLGHELRNPLAPIRNAVEYLKRHADPAQAEVGLATGLIDRQLSQLTRLVDDLLDVTRITKGKIHLQRTAVELNGIIENAAAAVAPAAAARSQQLSVQLPARSLRVDGDAVRLTQVLGNLLHNAIKYTGRGGDIRVSAEADGRQALIRVTDTGQGMDPELLPHIFDPFRQAPSATHCAEGGLGLGLTLVQRLVELHAGAVEACSEGIGKGSEFRVRLPLSSKPAAAAPREPVAAGDRLASHTAEGSWRVLVVDDNVDVARSFAMLLEAMGQEVQIAHSGADALAAVSACPPDVVLLDIGLPGMDGYETAARLRAEHPPHKLRLVAISGFSGDGNVERWRVAGFDAYLVKPVSMDVLESTLLRLRGLDTALPENA